MPNINVDVQPNEFYTSNSQAVLIDILNRHCEQFSYGYIFVGYPNWNQLDIDLFQYLDKNFLTLLKQGNTALVVDYTYEGFSHFECPVVSILEKNCTTYGIDSKKIFYFTGNLKATSQKINVIPIFTLDHEKSFHNFTVDVNEIKKLCLKKSQHEIFLSLSRRNRHHRVLAHAMLFNSPLKDYGIISQDRLVNTGINESILAKLGFGQKQWKRFVKSLPLIADADNFNINDPFNHLSELHYKTCFSIVNETLIDDYNNTSLFFSEKILKPIINFQPMIIYGQVGINHALKELGFRLYDDYFDLSFDYESDNIIRYKKLLESIGPVIKDLSEKSIEDQVIWRFKNLELLKHNFNNFIKQTHSNNAGKKFHELISKI